MVRAQRHCNQDACCGPNARPLGRDSAGEYPKPEPQYFAFGGREAQRLRVANPVKQPAADRALVPVIGLIEMAVSRRKEGHALPTDQRVFGVRFPARATDSEMATEFQPLVATQRPPLRQRG